MEIQLRGNETSQKEMQCLKHEKQLNEKLNEEFRYSSYLQKKLIKVYEVSFANKFCSAILFLLQ